MMLVFERVYYKYIFKRENTACVRFSVCETDVYVYISIKIHEQYESHNGMGIMSFWKDEEEMYIIAMLFTATFLSRLILFTTSNIVFKLQTKFENLFKAYTTKRCLASHWYNLCTILLPKMTAVFGSRSYIVRSLLYLLPSLPNCRWCVQMLPSSLHERYKNLYRKFLSPYSNLN